MRMQADDATTGPTPQVAVEHVELAAEVFRMLADSTRVMLLWLLLDRELSVNDLAQGSGRSQSSVSQHLAKLRLARIVQTRRQGNQIFYRIESDHVRQLVRDAIHHAEHAAHGVPEHHRSDLPTLDHRREVTSP